LERNGGDAEEDAMRDDVMRRDGLEVRPEDGRDSDEVRRDGGEDAPAIARWPRALDDVPTVRRRRRRGRR